MECHFLKDVSVERCWFICDFAATPGAVLGGFPETAFGVDLTPEDWAIQSAIILWYWFFK